MVGVVGAWVEIVWGRWWRRAVRGSWVGGSGGGSSYSA